MIDLLEAPQSAGWAFRGRTVIALNAYFWELFFKKSGRTNSSQTIAWTGLIFLEQLHYNNLVLIFRAKNCSISYKMHHFHKNLTKRKNHRYFTRKWYIDFFSILILFSDVCIPRKLSSYFGVNKKTCLLYLIVSHTVN